MQVALLAAGWVSPALIAMVTIVVTAIVFLALTPRSRTVDRGCETLSDRAALAESGIEEFERRKLAAR